MGEGAGVAESAALRRVRGGRPERGALDWWTIVPLLVVTVLIYNLIALVNGFFGDGALRVVDAMRAQVFPIPMASGVAWQVTWGDLLVILSLFMLFAELLKATGSSSTQIANHGLSMVLFILCLIEFLLVPAFASSTFFIIMMMTLLDVLAGVIVTINSARRDIAVEE